MFPDSGVTLTKTPLSFSLAGPSHKSMFGVGLLQSVFRVTAQLSALYHILHHIWCRKYEAYYHASNMQLARNQVQQAYLLNCLDSELYLRLTSAIAATTPVLGAGTSCLTMLANIFCQKYPILLKRKTFFSLEQQSGQDERAFLESIKGGADIQGNLEDALCLLCLTC